MLVNQLSITMETFMYHARHTNTLDIFVYRVFQILSQLKVLDGVNKLPDDLEFQDPGDMEDGSRGCVIQ